MVLRNLGTSNLSYPFTFCAFSCSNGYRKKRFGTRGHIFTDIFLGLNRHSSSFKDAFRVKKINYATYLLLYVIRDW